MTTDPEGGGQPTALVGSLLLVLIVLPLYLLTMVTVDDINVDAEPAAMPAWHLVQHGTVDLDGFDTNDNEFINRTPEGRLISDRPLALSLLAAPAYLITNVATYTPQPSTVTAALLTLASVLVLYLVLRRCLPARWAFGGAAVFALGTASWPISSVQLWPHGPGQLAAALVLLGLSAGQPFAAGLAAGVGVLVRPVTAVVGIVLAATAAWGRRWREAAALLLPTLLALGAVATYNRWAFGSFSISGGYASTFRDNITGQSPLRYLGNVVDMAVSPQNGMLFWSPMIIACLVGLWHAWATTPDWARRGAVTGLVYLLVHLRLNRASGGLPYDYRYPLEGLMLATPALVLGARALAQRGEAATKVLVAAVMASVLLQGIVATTFECVDLPNGDAQCSLL
jgi:hypothetical protein